MAWPERDKSCDLPSRARKTRIEADVPSSDALRRAENFEKAVRDRRSVCFSLPETKQRPLPSFLHITVIVGPPGSGPFDGTDIALPIIAPFLKAPFLPPESWFWSSSRLALGSALDIHFVAAWLPGEMPQTLGFRRVRREKMPAS